jgi:flagellar basal-body rod protein FlgC
MSEVRNVFDVAARAMSAQMVRLNTVASNMANVNSVSSTPEGAFRPLRPVFETQYNDAMGQTGLSTVDVAGVVSLSREAASLYRPDHPLADENGFVYQSTVDVDEEMVEMMEASRQYQNNLEVVSTVREMMARTVQMGR